MRSDKLVEAVDTLNACRYRLAVIDAASAYIDAGNIDKDATTGIGLMFCSLRSELRRAADNLEDLLEEARNVSS